MYRRKPSEIPEWEREAQRQIARRRLAKLQAKILQEQYPNKGLQQLADEIYADMVTTCTFSDCAAVTEAPFVSGWAHISNWQGRAGYYCPIHAAAIETLVSAELHNVTGEAS